MIYNGSQEEKDKISFMMLDMRGQGKIDFHSYEKFWINFLYMYGELLQVKMHYNADSEELTRQTFNQLVTVNGVEKVKTDEKGKKYAYFDLADFQKARLQYPELFEWLDYPEQYIETFLK